MPAALKTSSKAVRLHAFLDMLDDKSTTLAQTPREGYKPHVQFPVLHEVVTFDKVCPFLERPLFIAATTCGL